MEEHGIVPDLAESDEGYAESSSTSFATSIASSIRKGIEENGRLYPAYGQDAYGLPIDELEQERNDLQHLKYYLLMEERLHYSPLPEEPKEILDIGCGSGIWAIDIADKYPSAHVIGVDIAPVQPSYVPPNCEFQIDDMERDWLFADNTFDFIHIRDLVYAVRNWPRLIEQAKRALKPGGYLELNQITPSVGCDDNTIPENSPYVDVINVLIQIGEALKAPFTDPKKWKDQVIAAGFEDVVERILRMPVTPWPKDARLKKVGALELENFRKYCDGWMVRGLTAMGRQPEEAQILGARARAELLEKGRSMHIWLPFYSVYGRKPNTSKAPVDEPTPQAEAINAPTHAPTHAPTPQVATTAEPASPQTTATNNPAPITQAEATHDAPK